MIRTLVSRVNFKYGKPILMICHKNSQNMDAILRVVKYGLTKVFEGGAVFYARYLNKHWF